MLDAVWLCKVAERQMLRPSFVPPKPIRQLRDLTRYRIDLIGARTAEKNRVEKLLEDARIKLSVVASDIFGVSGRAMMAALIAGERDPKVLAQLARARMRAKISLLEEAFNGHFDDHHAFLLTTMLGRIDAINTDIAALDAQIEAQLAPFAAAAARLDDIPGIGPVAAAIILAEVGLDMSRFPTAGHLCSWARFSPGISSSAGKTKGNRSSGHGNRYLARVLGRGRSRGRQNRLLPRGEVPADRQTARQETRHRRRRTLDPGHRLAPDLRRTGPIHRSRSRSLHPPRQLRNQETQPHPPTRNPRLHRHPQPRRLTATTTADAHLTHRTSRSFSD